VYLHTDVDERRQVYREFFPLAAQGRRAVNENSNRQTFRMDEI
jgi:hypothetical protein